MGPGSHGSVLCRPTVLLFCRHMQSLGVCGGNNNRRREACQCPLVALKALVCTDVLPPGVSLTLRQGLLLGSEAQPWLHLATTKREADRLLREHIRAAGGTASGVPGTRQEAGGEPVCAGRGMGGRGVRACRGGVPSDLAVADARVRCLPGCWKLLCPNRLQPPLLRRLRITGADTFAPTPYVHKGILSTTLQPTATWSWTRSLQHCSGRATGSCAASSRTSCLPPLQWPPWPH